MSRPLLPLVGADPNQAREVTLVGRYAIGVTWGDGHASIYPFPALRAACPCGACGPSNASPVEIRREPGALVVVWPDGHESRLASPALRRRCLCAQCDPRARAAPP
jgi:DUF971 family protein